MFFLPPPPPPYPFTPNPTHTPSNFTAGAEDWDNTWVNFYGPFVRRYGDGLSPLTSGASPGGGLACIHSQPAEPQRIFATQTPHARAATKHWLATPSALAALPGGTWQAGRQA